MQTLGAKSTRQDTQPVFSSAKFRPPQSPQLAENISDLNERLGEYSPQRSRMGEGEATSWRVRIQPIVEHCNQFNLGMLWQRFIKLFVIQLVLVWVMLVGSYFLS